MRRAITALLCTTMLLGHLTYAQGDNYRNDVIWGIQGYFHWSRIENLQTTIIPESFFQNYDAKTTTVKNWGGGLFVNYRHTNSSSVSHFGLQLEAGYSPQGGKMTFENKEKNFRYDMDFKYRYISTGLLIKYYPFDYDAALEWAQGFNLAFGAQANFPLKSDDIYYKADGPGYDRTVFGSDLEQQQQLRNVLKSKPTTGLVFSAGFEIPTESLLGFNIGIEGRYVHGLDDAVETLPNSYNFIENYNNNSLKQIRLSFFF